MQFPVKFRLIVLSVLLSLGECRYIFKICLKIMGGGKKSVQNAFYFFTMEYKAKHPRRFDTINEFFEAAGPIWSTMSADERRPYEEMAKREKGKARVVKYTTTGIDISVIERREQEKETKKQKIREDIEDTISVAVNTERIADELFYIIYVNYFCRYTDNKKYVPAEISVARFTLRDGVTAENVFHMIVKPGPLQVGYSSIAKQISEEFHKLSPPASYQEEKDNMAAVFTGLKAFIMEMHPTGKLPPVYAEDKNIPVVEDVLETLIYEYGGSHENFNLCVYPLDYFFYTLRNAVGSINGKQVWPQLSNSILQLEKDIYDFCPDITCSFHELSDGPNHCSKSHVMRNVYIICDHCCGDLDIELIPGKHVPKKAHVVQTRPSSRASSTVSSYVTARSVAKQSTVKEEDYYLSTTESVFSETDTLVDPDDFPEVAGSLSYNESAYTDEDNWEQPKQRHRKSQNKHHDWTPVQSDHSQDSNYSSQRTENRSRRPVTLSAGLAGLSLSGPSGIRSVIGRGRGRGFSEK